MGVNAEKKILHIGETHHFSWSSSGDIAATCLAFIGVVEGMRRFATGVTIFAFIFWWWIFPYLVATATPQSFFVTNNRRDGPPRVFIDDGPLVYGDEGSPVVRLDWLAHRQFRDFRTVYIYHDGPNGLTACAPLDLQEPDGGFTDRAVSYQQNDVAFSLDRWTGHLLESCNLKPGKYVVVTEYLVPLLGGLFHKTFSLTSDEFNITPTVVTR